MTIKNNSLNDRLNQFKNKSSEPDNNINIDENTSELKDAIKQLFSSFVVLGLFLIKAIVYGYSIDVLFKMEWNFWQIICIGISINFIGKYIYDMFHFSKKQL